MRVVVAEDVMLMREGIVRVLRDEGVEVVAESADVPGLMGALAKHEPDCAIVDIRLPPSHTDEGVVAARRIRGLHPDVGVLVLSQYLEPGYAMELLQEHPERLGYLLKDRVSDPAILVDTLQRLRDGETVIDPTIVSILIKRHRDEDPLDQLSEREREVLGLVAEGLTNAEIARRLWVAHSTVTKHLEQAYAKLGVHTRTAAVARLASMD
jgi:DNA-binding NarL/FixJ family response regulator